MSINTSADGSRYKSRQRLPHKRSSSSSSSTALRGVRPRIQVKTPEHTVWGTSFKRRKQHLAFLTSFPQYITFHSFIVPLKIYYRTLIRQFVLIKNNTLSKAHQSTIGNQNITYSLRRAKHYSKKMLLQRRKNLHDLLQL